MDISENSSATHRRMQRSTTLNRKYVQKPTKTPTINSIAKQQADDLKRRQALAEKINRERLAAMKAHQAAKKTTAATKKVDPIAPPVKNPVVTAAKNKMSMSMKSSASARSARELKDSAVESALRSVATMESKNKNVVASSISTKKSFGLKKVLLALGCAVLCVGIIGYFVSLNIPDVSVRVAAMQAGFEATYPSYVPRGFSLKDIVSEDKCLVMSFANGEGTTFKLSEEKSAWDSDALESNYVKSTWDTDYTSVREQGITIFISASSATWVNGGILYKINAPVNSLTKKQIKSIVTSL